MTNSVVHSFLYIGTLVTQLSECNFCCYRTGKDEPTSSGQMYRPHRPASRERLDGHGANGVQTERRASRGDACDDHRRVSVHGEGGTRHGRNASRSASFEGQDLFHIGC